MATVSAPRPFSSISFWTCAGALWTPGAASASGTVSAPGPFRSIGFCTRAGAPWAPWTASASACLTNIASRSASIAAIWSSSNSSRSSSRPICAFMFAPSARPSPVQTASNASIPAQRLVIADPLRKQQTFDPIDMPYPLSGQRLALATNPAAVLVLRRGNPHHRTHPRLAPLERQQRPHQPLAIDLVGLGASATPRNRDRGRVHHVALDPFLHQSPVDPEPVEPGF